MQSWEEKKKKDYLISPFRYLRVISLFLPLFARKKKKKERNTWNWPKLVLLPQQITPVTAMGYLPVGANNTRHSWTPTGSPENINKELNCLYWKIHNISKTVSSASLWLSEQYQARICIQNSSVVWLPHGWFKLNLHL